MSDITEVFNALLTELKEKSRGINGGKVPSLSLTGSPLRKSKCLILGSNWGGDPDEITPQKSMPMANDILAYPDNPTYSGYITFFSQIFHKTEEVIDFLNGSVYTNGNLIRTPNERGKNRDILNDYRRVSHELLKKIVEVVSPEIIICFGNGELAGTDAIFKSLYNIDQFWTHQEIEIFELGPKNSSYFFASDGIKIYSFPHTSKYSIWGKELMANEVFNRLKKEIA